MVSASFDLLVEPWLPVRAGEQTVSVGLRELYLRAHEFDDLVVPVPPAASGLWRILYAITARLTGLDKRSSWAERQGHVLDRRRFDPESVTAYFDQYRNSFDLFHPERPWLQDPRLRSQCAKTSGVNKLVFGRPAGNAQVWFGHYNDLAPLPLPAAEAAWHLVAQLYYGASGRCTSREVDGQKFANSNAGPLRSAMSYHPLGGALFESLVLGVPGEHTANDEPDLCPWERPALLDPLAPPPALTWPGGLLTGRFQHAVLLVPDEDGRVVTDAYLTWGRRTPPMQTPDPYVIRRFSKQGSWYQLPADGSRALWRDVPALLCDITDESQRPRILVSAQDFDEGEQRVRAFGFDQDGQAKDRQWFTSVTPPILRWMIKYDEEAAVESVTVVKAAEDVGNVLAYLMKLAWQESTDVKDRVGPWVARVKTHYWPRAEDLFWSHLHNRTWATARKSYRQLGHEAIDWATNGEAHLPRFAAAIDKAHHRLTGKRQKGKAK
ncbi:type I-E CRISPR-associated protein Cse1/CasA [Solwaraspora sp. WMMD1047]|uniref:type I-E CRISPR-associated protein Cse1/CasA n=1 Tax=Solwaraspora sp. WMMD1047 TaxID=3016102 RepID=UPI002416E303|nr:type I-E CRISPR-associated protein Cse1/CasA [Solwaraspora sp. WMMD1047]MDG4827687.1 type I-E CRISPR-associated protein Cse1/CasA [Solwaraspora sp. WMMD1047]MDG4834878.1 type I-E CRISPR-associated protein Cse1/CasA [Solwaraspora sp. WMMD1047]MDG4834891.1 type I-E CRISPR-associated protein Cse1/CasA [Solwaraspora sp. WMMD1047]